MIILIESFKDCRWFMLPVSFIGFSCSLVTGTLSSDNDPGTFKTAEDIIFLTQKLTQVSMIPF